MKGARVARSWGILALLAGSLLVPQPVKAAEAEAEDVGPYPGTLSWHTEFGFRELVTRLQRAVTANGLTLVATSSADARAGQIPANLVLLVTRNDLAVQIVEANGLAGSELPIRIYVTEDSGRHASIIYRTPSSIFALYDNPKLDSIAADLDQIFAKTVDDAIGGS
jgi:uncharacterized protein (DUF302 family)